MNRKWEFNNGDLVRYNYLTQKDSDVGVVTAVDEFGDYRVVWTSGGIGWYTPAELEELCKSET